jgi:RNA polymerase sigma-70 factor (ECF subfamily)
MDLTPPTSLDDFLASAEKRAFGMAMVATMNHADALDIVQDAMFKLVKQYGHKASHEWPPLFHRILQHRITDWHRRQNSRRRWLSWLSFGDDEESPLEQAPAPTNTQPDHIIGQDGLREDIRQALHRLPLRQQQAFLLRQWEGLSVADTAHAMGCSQGSVKTHYSRAVHTLRSQLQEHTS